MASEFTHVEENDSLALLGNIISYYWDVYVFLYFNTDINYIETTGSYVVPSLNFHTPSDMLESCILRNWLLEIEKFKFSSILCGKISKKIDKKKTWTNLTPAEQGVYIYILIIP